MYLTYSSRVLFDFHNDTDMAHVLAVLLATFYVFDIKYPRVNKRLLEILDNIVLRTSHSNSNSKTKKSSLKELTIAAQNVIAEYEKQLSP